MNQISGIKIFAPGPGTCPVCAARHKPEAPHDRNSLYYQHRFRRENRRFPTWADAMRHCDGKTRMEWARRLTDLGVPAEEISGDGGA